MVKMKTSNEKNIMIFVFVKGLLANKMIINKNNTRDIIGVVNLLEIPSWNNMKTQDNVATVSFSKINLYKSESAYHYSFPFTLNSY